ncbi:MAG: xylulokinase [Phycisphaeraceae bacterium]|nr:xylulokinase [Phycisphaeraceae bacterium]
MALLLGVDIGTSAAKAILCDEHGGVLATSSVEYAVTRPREGWSEQDPELWWKGVASLVPTVARLSGRSSREITAVGLSGQMHGSVLLGRETLAGGGTGAALRTALLWNDQRTAKQCAQIESRVGGRASLVRETGNAALPGFTLPKLMWVREHEPELWGRVGCVLMPKDFVRWRLTGQPATDVGDASGTLLYDPSRRAWSPTVCDAAEIDPAILPRVHESGEVAGTVTRWASAQTGLAEGTAVVAGSGDNMMGALGAGVVREGVLLATLGTSGVVYAHTKSCRPDLVDAAACGRTHAMCSATGTDARPGGWCTTGCMLSGAGALSWAQSVLAPGVPFDDLMREAGAAPAGCGGLVFLPHLTGERCPHADPAARGAWVGLTARHTRGSMIRALIEGVTLTMAQIIGIFRRLGIESERVLLGGGGAKSTFWRQMQADIYGCEVAMPTTAEGPALGAALLAGVAVGAWPSIEAACAQVIRDTEVREPDEEARRFYADHLRMYGRVYPALRETFAAMPR